MSRTKWIPVPAGTPATTCRSPRCGKVIYFAPHPGTGRPHPVDCSVPGGVEPSQTVGGVQRSLMDDPEAPEPRVGRGVSHFETCVSAGQFRRQPQDSPYRD